MLCPGLCDAASHFFLPLWALLQVFCKLLLSSPAVSGPGPPPPQLLVFPWLLSCSPLQPLPGQSNHVHNLSYHLHAASSLFFIASPEGIILGVRAAVPECHRQDGYKQQNLSFYSPLGAEVQDQGASRFGVW